MRTEARQIAAIRFFQFVQNGIGALGTVQHILLGIFRFLEDALLNLSLDA